MKNTHQAKLPFLTTPTTLIVYHGDCPDGALAAWLLRRALVADGQYISRIAAEGVYPGRTPMAAFAPKVEKVYFVDTCPLQADYDRLVAAGKTVAIYDHHLTATIPGAVIDHSECGASLVAREFNAPRDRLIDYVKDLDLYANELPNTFDVRRVICTHMRWIDDVSLLAHRFDTDWTGVLAEGESLRLAHDNAVTRLADTAELTKIAGMDVWHAICPNRDLCSDVANELANRHGGVGCTSRAVGGGRSYSLRSTVGSEFDVSAIALQFGGGGHRHAAGFFTAAPTA